MISQNCVKKKKKSVHSLFLLQLQMRKNVKGFKSESLPNESKNLGCVVKLHTVEAFGGAVGKTLRLNLHLGNSLKKGWF